MLTRKDLYEYFISQGCEVNPFDGINRTANQVEIINPKAKRSFFIATPISDKYFVPGYVVALACTKLSIDIPKNFKEHYPDSK